MYITALYVVKKIYDCKSEKFKLFNQIMGMIIELRVKKNLGKQISFRTTF